MLHQYMYIYISLNSIVQVCSHDCLVDIKRLAFCMCRCGHWPCLPHCWTSELASSGLLPACLLLQVHVLSLWLCCVFTIVLFPVFSSRCSYFGHDVSSYGFAICQQWNLFNWLVFSLPLSQVILWLPVVLQGFHQTGVVLAFFLSYDQ